MAALGPPPQGRGEDDASAVERSATFELGVAVGGLREGLPGYRYRAEFRGVVPRAGPAARGRRARPGR